MQQKKKTFVKFAKIFLDLVLREVLFFRLEIKPSFGFIINEELFTDAPNINLTVSDKPKRIKEWRLNKMGLQKKFNQSLLLKKNYKKTKIILQETKSTLFKIILKKITKQRLDKFFFKLVSWQPRIKEKKN